MQKRTALVIMFVIGFLGFIGSAITGSFALAAVACGFFGGTTCAVAMMLVDEPTTQTRQEQPKQYASTPKPQQPKSNQPKYIKSGMVYILNPKYKEVANAPSEVSNEIPSFSW